MKNLLLLTRRSIVGVALAAAVAPAWAQDKVAIATSANPEVAAAYVGVEEGLFSKNGMDAEIKITTLNPIIPASLVSNSVQIGAPTPTVFMQAVESGLDLVIIAGVSVVTPGLKSVAVAVRPDSPIATAKDFIGKTVGVPGLNAILHVTLQLWLDKNGVDPKSVRFVEGALPVLGDLLKQGQADAVVLVDPFLTRSVQGNTAKVVAYFLPEVAAGQQTMYYATTREWAEKNPKKVAAFRQGLTEASAFIKANPDKTRDDTGKYFKVPPAVLKTLAMPETAPVVTPQQVDYWNDLMPKLGMLKTRIDPKKVIWP